MINEINVVKNFLIKIGLVFSLEIVCILNKEVIVVIIILFVNELIIVLNEVLIKILIVNSSILLCLIDVYVLFIDFLNMI